MLFWIFKVNYYLCICKDKDNIQALQQICVIYSKEYSF